MYAIESDFHNLIAKDDFDAALAEGFTSMEAITRTACATVQNYLYQRYRIRSEFDKMGDDRNAHLVMIVCDIALYHMVSAMPQKMGSEIRKERYERAIKWLEGVQAGKIIPDLPLVINEDNMPGGTTLFSSQPQLHHTW